MRLHAADLGGVADGLWRNHECAEGYGQCDHQRQQPVRRDKNRAVTDHGGLLVWR
jgi:hypothetical protein